jgi:hypothetical protein
MRMKFKAAKKVASSGAPSSSLLKKKVKFKPMTPGAIRTSAACPLSS